MTEEIKHNKVAQITIFFWIMKVIATTLGETLGDFFSMTLNLGYIVSLLIAMGFFAVVLIGQLRLKSFVAPVYWLVIVGTTTAGTEVSDLLDRTLGLGYTLGSLLLFGLFIGTLYLWHRQKKEIVVYPVTDRGVEIYYWVAILFSNSLGTAFGDFLSDNIGLSYGYGAMVTAAIIAVVVTLHYYTKLNELVLFWIAFIFTRPFGATFGDLLTKPTAKGGLNLGTLQASLVAAVLLAIVLYISTRRDKKREEFQQVTA